MTKQESVENCEKIFVSWTWAIGFVVSFIVIIAGLSWSTATAYSNIVTTQTTQQTEINQLKTIYKDIDTVKILLRDMKNVRSNTN